MSFVGSHAEPPFTSLDAAPGKGMLSKKWFGIFLLSCAALGPPADAPGKGMVCTEKGIVVSACPIASRVGADILDKGGTAADAAVAVGFALAVTYPQAGNIGGGGFALLRSASGSCHFIDFRERAPAAASREMYLDGNGEVIQDASLYGHGAVGVPGTVAGLHLLFEEHCTMPWEALIEPALSLARGGFVVSEHLADSFARLGGRIAHYPGLSVFCGEDGEPLGAGDLLRQPELAMTLERIARGGPDDFYRGETARLICAEMERGGGLVSARDLESYRAVNREPVYGSYRGYEIVSAPPPSSGGAVLLQILNILEGFPLGSHRFLSTQTVHLVTEAERRAYRDRASFLGDPDYVDNHLSVLLSKEYANDLREDITSIASRSDSLAAPPVAALEAEETTHYSIIDAAGNVALSTTTLNGSFGAMVVVRGGGFLLNNEMDDFAIKPGFENMYGLTGGAANAIEPGKRMLSSMAPTIVLSSGRPYLLLGTPGGSTIITTVAQIIMNVIDFGMDVDSAVSSPRFHHQWIPDEIQYEPGAFDPALLAALEERGHSCRARATSIGDAQVIMCGDALRCGMSDPRGGGSPAEENERYREREKGAQR